MGIMERKAPRVAIRGNGVFSSCSPGILIKLLIFSLLNLFCANPLLAKSYVTTKTGNWQASSNWTSNDWPNSISDNASIKHSIDVKKDQDVGKVNFDSTAGSLNIKSNSTLTIDDTLDLTKGKITVNSGSELILTSNATLTGVTDSNYIDGPYKMKGSDSLVFKLMGKNGIVKLTIHKLTSLSTYEVVYKDSSPSNQYGSTLNSPLQSISHEEYFKIDRSNGSGTARVTLFWNQDGTATSLGNLSSMSELVIAHYNGSKWDSVGRYKTTGVLNDTGYITSDTMSSFSPFTFGSTDPSSSLPVELLFFKADRKKHNKVQLKWATASETNNAYFEIQRSKGGKHFQKVGKVKGHATSTIRHDYQFSDYTQRQKTLYYRLKQVDFDGSKHYSKVISANYSPSQEGLTIKSIHPQPIAKNSQIVLNTDETGSVKLVAINVTGNKMSRFRYQISDPGKQKIPLNNLIQELDEGFYQLMIKQGQKVARVPLIKKQ